MEILVGDIGIPNLKAFLAYGETLRGERVAPSWEDFTLLALDAKVIPHIIVVDVLRHPLDFFMRFWGTAHVTAKGFDKTGKSVNDPPRFRGTSAFNEYSRILKEKRPLASKGMVKVPHLDRGPFSQQSFACPFPMMRWRWIKSCHWRFRRSGPFKKAWEPLLSAPLSPRGRPGNRRRSARGAPGAPRGLVLIPERG